MQIINKDILTVEKGTICHQVNCMGVMGTGIALSIKQTWPIVFQEYKNKMLWPRYKNLGRAQVIQVGPELYCTNLFGQFDYGRDYRRTEYGSIYMALRNLKAKLSEDQYPVYFPYKISCNNAGANWDLVQEMLDELFPECYICKLENNE